MKIDLEDVAKRCGRSVEEVLELIRLAKASMIPLGKQIRVVEKQEVRWLIVARQGVGIIQTEFGEFQQFDFLIDDQWGKYSVLYYGAIDDNLMPVFEQSELLLMRVDSGCETGQMFGDKTCECREQLRLAIRTVAENGGGLIVHIPRQDGRGLGLPAKLATLRLQHQLKLDTVAAANIIAPDGVIDIRTYGGVIGVLKFFEVPETMMIALATNNLQKTPVFVENGYQVKKLVPMIIEPTEFTHQHLKAKQDCLGHIGLLSKVESTSVDTEQS